MMKTLHLLIIIIFGISIIVTTNLAFGKGGTPKITLWAEPEGQVLYSTIPIYANFCHMLTDYHLSQHDMINFNTTVTKPDGSLHKLEYSVPADESFCKKIGVGFIAPYQPGLYKVHTAACVNNNSCNSDPEKNQEISITIQKGIFQDINTSDKVVGKSETIVSYEKLKELAHQPREENTLLFKVLDWSRDGKSILVGYCDYADSNFLEINSLALVDAQTFDVKKINVITVNENNTQEIYRAKISPSGNSIFVLLGKESQRLGHPENIFKYNLNNNSLVQITNSSTVAWFDTLNTNDDGKMLAYIDSVKGFHIWPVDDTELGSKIDKVAEKFYVYLSQNHMDLDVNNDATKLVFSYGGLFYMDMSLGTTSYIPPRMPCVESSTFAPNSSLIIYNEYTTLECRGPAYSAGGLRIASTDGTMDETIYLDDKAQPDTVVSPDGKYIASYAVAKNRQWILQDIDNNRNHQYNDVDPQGKPRIVRIDLPRPVPEFGSISGLIFAVSLISVISLAAIKFRK